MPRRMRKPWVIFEMTVPSTVTEAWLTRWRMTRMREGLVSEDLFQAILVAIDEHEVTEAGGEDNESDESEAAAFETEAGEEEDGAGDGPNGGEWERWGIAGELGPEKEERDDGEGLVFGGVIVEATEEVEGQRCEKAEVEFAGLAEEEGQGESGGEEGD
jgi:hypothetical protein